MHTYRINFAQFHITSMFTKSRYQDNSLSAKREGHENMEGKQRGSLT